jgi:hypothetical protein
MAPVIHLSSLPAVVSSAYPEDGRRVFEARAKCLYVYGYDHADVRQASIIMDPWLVHAVPVLFTRRDMLVGKQQRQHLFFFGKRVNHVFA